MAVIAQTSKDEEPKKAHTNEIDAELEQILANQRTRIKVVGCGGGGNNTVNRITEVGVRGAETIAINTDSLHLNSVQAHKKVLNLFLQVLDEGFLVDNFGVKTDFRNAVIVATSNASTTMRNLFIVVSLAAGFCFWVCGRFLDMSIRLVVAAV